MSTPDQTVLAWTDVETTGLNAHEDNLLEVACILTDMAGNEVGTERFSRVVGYSPEDVGFIRSRTIEYVNDMHEKSGLWEDLPGGEPDLSVIEADLLAFVATAAPEARSAWIAGSSIRLDMNFMEVDLPAVAEHLHYRSVDVSGFRQIVVANDLADPQPETDSAHRGLADVEASLSEYRHLLGQLARKRDLDRAVKEAETARADAEDYRARWQRACDAQANMQGAVQHIMDQLNTANGVLVPILLAWTDEGPQPGFHRAAQERLEKEWPTLADAVKALVAVAKPAEGAGESDG